MSKERRLRVWVWLSTWRGPPWWRDGCQFGCVCMYMTWYIPVVWINVMIFYVCLCARVYVSVCLRINMCGLMDLCIRMDPCVCVWMPAWKTAAVHSCTCHCRYISLYWYTSNRLVQKRQIITCFWLYAYFIILIHICIQKTNSNTIQQGLVRQKGTLSSFMYMHA